MENPINYWYQKYLSLKAEMDKMKAVAVEGEVSAVILHENRDEVHYAITYPEGESPHSITDKVKIIIL